ncbi:hypothetical protein FrEUN1fDRAFT_4524 [Parafrankia sp. EUN1f]|nr:hypothetical protein FrEUN1fDRAFT_4524 [Parafrankia sp. EUN1f]
MIQGRQSRPAPNIRAGFTPCGAGIGATIRIGP